MRRHDNAVVNNITLARPGGPGGVVGLRLLSQSVSLVIQAGRHSGRITGAQAHAYYREPNININYKYVQAKGREIIQKQGRNSEVWDGK